MKNTTKTRDKNYNLLGTFKSDKERGVLSIQPFLVVFLIKTLKVLHSKICSWPYPQILD
jgi:hypothetical protein